MPTYVTLRNMCEMFNCTPAEALAQDPAYVLPIFGLVAAEEAIRVSSNKDTVGSLTKTQGEILFNLRGETIQKPSGPDLSWLLELENEDIENEGMEVEGEPIG